jgi:hypothetical protein
LFSKGDVVECAAAYRGCRKSSAGNQQLDWKDWGQEEEGWHHIGELHRVLLSHVAVVQVSGNFEEKETMALFGVLGGAIRISMIYDSYYGLCVRDSTRSAAVMLYNYFYIPFLAITFGAMSTLNNRLRAMLSLLEDDRYWDWQGLLVRRRLLPLPFYALERPKGSSKL